MPYSSLFVSLILAQSHSPPAAQSATFRDTVGATEDDDDDDEDDAARARQACATGSSLLPGRFHSEMCCAALYSTDEKSLRPFMFAMLFGGSEL
ncbi:hypothetical protein E4U41_005937 [Claviceps citrina]|nr:hypothetical protein E4U41_005937 [Claviceps citrina]